MCAENWTIGKKSYSTGPGTNRKKVSYRTGLGTARKSRSVLEQDPERTDDLNQL